jgi:hypothetical protein
MRVPMSTRGKIRKPSVKGNSVFIPGRLSKGAEAAMIVKAPLSTPAAPQPAIALPKINITDETDTPQISDPSSKRATAPRKTN